MFYEAAYRLTSCLDDCLAKPLQQTAEGRPEASKFQSVSSSEGRRFAKTIRPGHRANGPAQT